MKNKNEVLLFFNGPLQVAVSRNNKKVMRIRNTFAFKVLLSIFILGLLAPVISNDKPLYVKLNKKTYFPALSWNETSGDTDQINYNNTNWKTIENEGILFAPFTYSNVEFDYINAGFISPFEKQQFVNKQGQITEMPLRYRHWLGTGKKGEDVLAVLVYGARYTFIISFTAVAIALCIGLFLGILAGYYGNQHFKTTYLNLTGFFAGLLPGYFYGFYIRSLTISGAFASSQWNGLLQVKIGVLILLSIAVAGYLICDWISELLSIKKRIFIPFDSIITKTIELFVSIPALIMIISFAAIMKPSLLTIILIIGLTAWTTIARLVRAEMMRLKNLDFIQSAKALGYHHPYIIIKHALPNISASLWTVVVFTIASAMIIEASLTFLGLGVPHNITTWGSLLAQSKDNFGAWWISLLPGTLIFTTLYCLNKLAAFKNQ